MPSLDRRTFLAGSATLGSGAVGGGVLFPETLLPSSVAWWLSRARPVPEMSARPPVTDGHESAAVASLRSSIERAERAWNRAENQSGASDELPNIVDPERSLRSARSYLDSARDASGWDALFDVKQGARFAGRAIGGARLARGEASGETLAANAREIQGAVADERDRIAYEAADTSTGVARLYWVEKWLVSAHLNAYRDGTYMGQDEPTTEYDDHDVVRTWGSHLQARRSRADATRLYDDYRAGLDGDLRDLTDHVERADEQLLAEAKELTFTTEEFERRNAAIESLPDGPYRRFRWVTMFYVQNADVRGTDDISTGVPVYRAIQNAEVVLQARAFAAIRADERLSRDADRVPDSLLADAKREGLSLLEDRLDAAENRPVLELLVREGRRLLWAGDTDLEGSGEVPHPRAEAYAKFRLAVEYLREVESVAATIDRPDGG